MDFDRHESEREMSNWRDRDGLSKDEQFGPEREPWEDEPQDIAVSDLSPAGTLTAEERNVRRRLLEQG